MHREFVQILAPLINYLAISKIEENLIFFFPFNFEIFQTVSVPIMKPLCHAQLPSVQTK